MMSVAEKQRRRARVWQVPATIVALSIFGAFFVTAVLTITSAGL